MSGWVALVYALAVARVTGLVTVDEITRPAREAILRRLNEHRRSHIALGYLITCPWCASIWVAAGAVALALPWGTSLWLLAPALVLAASQVTGMVSDLGRSQGEA